MIDFKNALVNAIDKNEMIDFLEGNKGYYYEDGLCPGPTDFSRVMRAVYSEYLNNREIKSKFCEALDTMLNGSVQDIYYAILYIQYHFSFKDDEDATFEIDEKRYVSRIRDLLHTKQDELKKIYILSGITIEKSLWECLLDIEDMLKDFGISIM